MNDYLAKPFTKEQLRATLARWLKRREALAANGATISGAPAQPARALPPVLRAVSRLHAPDAAAAWPAEIARAAIDARALDNIRSAQRAGAPDLLGRVVAVYFEDAPKLIGAMRSALIEADLPGLSRSAHILKSASANLGATRLAGLCQQLEKGARAGEMANAHDPMNAIENEYAQVEAALRSELFAATA
jgi:HPt (histidine-containing phosphotransfer) domain-containing protein